MLAVSPFRNSYREDEREESKTTGEKYFCMGSNDEFITDNFSGENLLDSIDFDELFVGIDVGDLLPDLEMDPTDILADFSVPIVDGSTSENGEDEGHHQQEVQETEKFNPAGTSSVVDSGSSSSNTDQEIVSKSGFVESTATVVNINLQSESTAVSKRIKLSTQSNNPGKRKVKIDWTPELHRRFVQAVEQLGVDKAVPSKILEIMGTHSLTRHNIASHLQKYRSHRKHLQAREAEEANWSQKRRQSYGVSAVRGGGGKKDNSMTISNNNNNPWPAPTIGFPPMQPLNHHFRPLHVWGHPSVDQSLVQYVWPKHLPHSTPPSHLPAPPRDPSFWHSHQFHVPNTLTAGTPCFSASMVPMRFQIHPPVPGIPTPTSHAAMYSKPNSASATTAIAAGVGLPTAPTGHTFPHPPVDLFHPSRETVDAAIEEVLTKPTQSLPLGLKPPSTDSVLIELQRQGISKIPPAAATSA